MSLFDSKPKSDPTGTILIGIAKWTPELREVFFGTLELSPEDQKALGEILADSCRIVEPSARDAFCERIEEMYCIGCGEKHEDGCVCEEVDEDEGEGEEEWDEDEDDDAEDGDDDVEDDDEEGEDNKSE